MFGMVNPEGSTEGAEAALRVADQVATHVDKTVWNAIDQTLMAMKDMTPDLAAQTKQVLYDYIKDTGLTGQQLEAAGIPRDYFASMSEDAGGKGDNFFAMSKAGEGDGLPKRMKLSESASEIEYLIDKETGRLQRSDMGKLRPAYKWPVLDEQFTADCIRQSHDDSCISAVGEMITKGQFSESQLISKIDHPSDLERLMKTLGPEWTNEKGPTSLAEIGRGGPWAAQMNEKAWSQLPKSEHVVVVDGPGAPGNVVIRDPLEGTRYEMTISDFKLAWNRNCVYRKVQKK
jgi:hypothetical protein